MRQRHIGRAGNFHLRVAV